MDGGGERGGRTSEARARRCGGASPGHLGHFLLKLKVLTHWQQRVWMIPGIFYPNPHFPLKMNVFTTILEDSPHFLAKRSVSWTFENECFGEKATILEDSPDFLAKRPFSFENERFGL